MAPQNEKGQDEKGQANSDSPETDLDIAYGDEVFSIKEMDEALQRMTCFHVAILRLHVDQDMEAEEIAHEIGWEKGSVESSLGIAMSRLHDELKASANISSDFLISTLRLYWITKG